MQFYASKGGFFVTRLDWWRLHCRFWSKLIGTTSELLPGDCSRSSLLGGDFGKDLVGAPSNVSRFVSSRGVGRGRSGKRACGDVVLLQHLTVTLTEQNNCQEDRLFSRRRSPINHREGISLGS